MALGSQNVIRSRNRGKKVKMNKLIQQNEKKRGPQKKYRKIKKHNGPMKAIRIMNSTSKKIHIDTSRSEFATLAKSDYYIFLEPLLYYS